MKTFALVFVFLILAAVYTDANPVMKESDAKQLVRSKRQEYSYEWVDLALRGHETSIGTVMV